jgi:hypothetical protein
MSAYGSERLLVRRNGSVALGVTLLQKSVCKLEDGLAAAPVETAAAVMPPSGIVQSDTGDTIRTIVRAYRARLTELLKLATGLPRATLVRAAGIRGS